MRTYIIQFVRYTLYGSGAAIVDISILWTSVEIFGIHYIIATVVAFVAATILNYVVFRRFVFDGTKRNLYSGYLYFLSFATIGMVITVSCMVFFIEVIHLGIISSRVTTAIIVGFWNFSMNYFLNFKTQKTEEKDA